MSLMYGAGSRSLQGQWLSLCYLFVLGACGRIGYDLQEAEGECASAGVLCGVGDCAGGTTECIPGTEETRCSTMPGGSEDQSQAEICDGRDNDCDGTIDFGSMQCTRAFLDGWAYRKTLTVAASQITADLSDFSLLVRAVDMDWRAEANGGHVAEASGSDIRFTDADGLTLLDHEIEHYDPMTGELIAWVRLPLLSSTVDTELFAYYGNASAPAPPNPAKAWDADFRAIWHLHDDFLDSTAFANAGTNSGSTTIAGMIGEGQSFDGVDDFIDVGSDSSIDDLYLGGGTVSAWIFPIGWGEGNYGRIIDKTLNNLAGQGHSFRVFVSGDVRTQRDFETNRGNWFTAPNSIVLGQWYHVVSVYDDSDIDTAPDIYINGVSQSIAADDLPAGARLSDAAHSLFIGNAAWGTDRTFEGIIDELRLSKTMRSAAWIAAEHDNQRDPSSFVAIGVEEVP